MIERILAMIAVCVGTRHADEHRLYAEAIAHVTSDVQEQRLLVVVAWAGNWFHTYGDPQGLRRNHTPFFDVTEYAATHPTERISLERGAGLALRFLRLHHNVRCRGQGWAVALGRFHTGQCEIDRLAVRQMELIRRMP